MSGSPMGPKRLAELRIKVAGMVEHCAAQTEGGTDQWTPVAELLADRDHFRSRCPVTAEDVDGDITAKARAWAFAAGFKRPEWWAPKPEALLGEEHDDWFVHHFNPVDEGVMACDRTPQQRVADLANWATAYVAACPLDILDEMVAGPALEAAPDQVLG